MCDTRSKSLKPTQVEHAARTRVVLPRRRGRQRRGQSVQPQRARTLLLPLLLRSAASCSSPNFELFPDPLIPCPAPHRDTPDPLTTPPLLRAPILTSTRFYDPPLLCYTILKCLRSRFPDPAPRLRSTGVVCAGVLARCSSWRPVLGALLLFRSTRGATCRRSMGAPMFGRLRIHTRGQLSSSASVYQIRLRRCLTGDCSTWDFFTGPDPTK